MHAGTSGAAQSQVFSRPADDADVIRNTIAGDANAYALLVQRYYTAVFATAYGCLKDREAAEELVQEAFLRAYLKLDTLKLPEYFPFWVHRIARHLAADWLRKGRRQSEILQMVPLTDAVSDQAADESRRSVRDQLSDSQDRKRLTDAVLRLPDELREVVLLHFMEEPAITIRFTG